MEEIGEGVCLVKILNGKSGHHHSSTRNFDSKLKLPTTDPSDFTSHWGGFPAHVEHMQEIINLQTLGNSTIPQLLGQCCDGFRLGRFRYILQKK